MLRLLILFLQSGSDKLLTGTVIFPHERFPISNSTETGLCLVGHLFQNSFKIQPGVCPAKNSLDTKPVLLNSVAIYTYIYKKTIFFA